ncbi:MAG: EscU/YscU/HrcU family type III secretion system export apparatus switch protein [Mariprofundaceae bacterium]
MSRKKRSRLSPQQLQAVALRWLPDQEPAPRLIAKGAGEMADKIIAIAKANNIPVREDRDLVQILSWLDTGEEIPSEVHTVIAEILIFIYWTSKRYQDVFESGSADTNSKHNTTANRGVHEI